MPSRTTDPAAQAAAVLAAELSEPRDTDRPPSALEPSSASREWAASGAMYLTGRSAGPPRLAPGGPASWMRAAASFLDSAVPDPAALLGERAACAALRRQAPRSVGGAFRSMRAADGWFGLTLAREGDIELLPAFVEAAVDGDPWGAVTRWVARRPAAEAQARARLLGLPGVRIGAIPGPVSRPAVRVLRGGPRRARRDRPLVVDLSALWAGPLCAQLLGMAGARVIKVESWDRPDGARRGPRAFYDLMHGGHESVALHLDRPDERAALAELVRRADVVIEASRPRALRQLGLRAEEYVAAGTVWVAISAYGREEEDRVGFGDDVAAAAGLVADDGDGPYPVGDAIADPIAGITAAAAAAAALRSDRGWLLDISMCDVAAAAAQLTADEAAVTGQGDEWWVSGTGESVPVHKPVSVREPRARTAPAPAPELGSHTESVLAELGDRTR